jgi:hypothetical protein
MSELLYSSLSLGSDIRLLRLFPNEDQNEPIQCQLLDYSLHKLRPRTHLYEALSYVWSNPDETLPIRVNGIQFRVTLNLHAALLHLRDRSLELFLWVDAICINQNNLEERKQQVQLMAKIYSQARHVIIWLGVAADHSGEALEAIRIAADKQSANSSNDETIQQSIVKLLDRPWFQRIWVREQSAIIFVEVAKSDLGASRSCRS